MFVVVTLFVLALLSVLTSVTIDRAQSELEGSELALAQVQSRALALSGIQAAEALIATDPTPAVAYAGDAWAAAEPVILPDLDTGRIVLGRAPEPHAPHAGPLGFAGSALDTLSVIYAGGITDESRKLSFFALPRAVLEPIVPPEILAVLPAPGSPNGTAADSTAWPPPLRSIAGSVALDADRFEALRPILTPYGDGRVNVNLADRDVLTAVGMSESLADVTLRYRAGSDGVPGTPDDDIFAAADSIPEALGRGGWLNARDAATLRNLVSEGRLGVGGDVFHVTARGIAGPGVVRVEAVVERHRDGGTRIIDWSEW